MFEIDVDMGIFEKDVTRGRFSLVAVGTVEDCMALEVGILNLLREKGILTTEEVQEIASNSQKSKDSLLLQLTTTPPNQVN